MISGKTGHLRIKNALRLLPRVSKTKEKYSKLSFKKTDNFNRKMSNLQHIITQVFPEQTTRLPTAYRTPIWYVHKISHLLQDSTFFPISRVFVKYQNQQIFQSIKIAILIY
jgi:hypothetical protein